MRPAGSPYAVFQRALRHGNLWVAEAEAREMRVVSLEDALKLVYLYAEKESPKYERAAMKWLRRDLDEKEPTLKNFAKVVRSFEQQRRAREHGSWNPQEREARKERSPPPGSASASRAKRRRDAPPACVP